MVISAWTLRGRRMTARVIIAVFIAFWMISWTSLAVSAPGTLALLALGPTSHSSGGSTPAVAGTTYVPPVYDAMLPADMPAGSVVWVAKGNAIPPTITTPGGGS